MHEHNIATGCSGASRAHIILYCGYSHRRVDLRYDKTWTATGRRVKPLFDETVRYTTFTENSVIEFLWWFEGSDVICYRGSLSGGGEWWFRGRIGPFRFQYTYYYIHMSILYYIILCRCRNRLLNGLTAMLP